MIFFCKNSRETEPKNWKTEKLEIPYVVTMKLWWHSVLNKDMKNWAKKKSKTQNYENPDNEGELEGKRKK